MSILNIQLGITSTPIITATAETAILAVIFCNTDTVARVISFYAYPSGGSASDTTCIIKSLSIAALDTYIFAGNEKIILDTGGVVAGICDAAAKVTVTPSYKVL